MKSLALIAIVLLGACGQSHPMDPGMGDGKADVVVCRGALPKTCEACADGTTGCAHFDANCNIVTCEPKQCTGLLPKVCEACADGTTGCAHFDAKLHLIAQEKTPTQESLTYRAFPAARREDRSKVRAR
jgi:hypothetical protein